MMGYLRWIRVAGVAVMVAACSTPTKHVDEPPPPRSDAVADTVVVPSDAAVEDAPSDAVAVAVATFAWQEARDWYEAFKKTPIGSKSLCDFRVPANKRPRGLECLPRGGLVSQAAKVRRTQFIEARRCEVELDLGSDDSISTAWKAALVDERDRLLSDWVPVVKVSPHYSEIRLDVGCMRAEHYARVAMKREL